MLKEQYNIQRRTTDRIEMNEQNRKHWFQISAWNGDVVMHKHHMIPRHPPHCGPDISSNIVKVDILEHAIMHYELYKETGCKECRKNYKTLLGMSEKWVELYNRYNVEEFADVFDIDEDEPVLYDDNVKYVEDDWTEKLDADIIKQSISEEIQGALDTLSERESIVLKMFYGIDRELPMKKEWIAEEFDLSRQRVHEILLKAEERLRHRSRSKNLKPYLNYFQNTG